VLSFEPFQAHPPPFQRHRSFPLDYPRYDPQFKSDPLTEAELDALDNALAALPGDAAMNVEALDGYLTALIVGPVPVMEIPTTRWLPRVWGGDAQGDSASTLPFASQKQRKRVVLWVLRHLHTVAAQFQDIEFAQAHWQPLLSIAEQADREWLDAEDWCAGFLLATELAPEAWSALFEHTALSPVLRPLVLLGADPLQLSDADHQQLADPEQRDALSRAAIEAVLALCVHGRS